MSGTCMHKTKAYAIFLLSNAMAGAKNHAVLWRTRQGRTRKNLDKRAQKT